MKRKSNRSKEHFARIPLSVLESDAVKTLPHATFKVMVLLAAQWRGTNNGSLALTDLYQRQYGLSGRNTLYRSLHELERRGLIVCTRQGIKSKKVFSLWALGWENVTHRDGVPLDVPEIRNNRRWLDWKPSSSYLEAKARRTAANKANASKRKKIQTHDGYSTVPTMGTDDPVSVPIVGARSSVSIPTMGNTSRVLAGASNASGSLPAPVPIPDPNPKTARSQIRELNVRIGNARKFLAAAPGTDDAKLMQLYQLTGEQLKQLKATG